MMTANVQKDLIACQLDLIRELMNRLDDVSTKDLEFIAKQDLIIHELSQQLKMAQEELRRRKEEVQLMLVHAHNKRESLLQENEVLIAKLKQYELASSPISVLHSIQSEQQSHNTPTR